MLKPLNGAVMEVLLTRLKIQKKLKEVLTLCFISTMMRRNS